MTNRFRRALIARICLFSALIIVEKRSVALPQGSKTTGKTIRYHKVAGTDEFPAEIREAEAAIDKKDYTGAEKLLTAFVAREPKGYRAWFDLAFVYTAQDRSQDAILAYRKAVAAKPDSFESNLNLGLMLAQGKNPDAATFLRAATGLKPTDLGDAGLVRAWSSLAQVLENKSPQEAAAAYSEALKLQPKDAEAHLALGGIMEQSKDEKGAEAEYQQALKLATPSGNSVSGDAVTALANLYMRQKRFAEADAMLRKLVAAHPDDAVTHVQLGRVLAAEAKYDDATTELKTGLKLAPNDTSAVRDLADVDSLNKKDAEAEPLYRQLLKTQSGIAELHHALGKSLLEQHKFAEAQEEFMAAVKLKPDLGGAYGDLAAAANENKDYPLTIRALDARAKFLPELPIGYFMRASAFDHLRDHKNASLFYHKFLDVADGRFPDQEWQARHRLIAIEPKK